MDSDELTELSAILTVKQVAGLLQVSDNSVKSLCRTNKLPARKVGKTWRINKNDVLDYMNLTGGGRDVPAPSQAQAPTVVQSELIANLRRAAELLAVYKHNDLAAQLLVHAYGLEASAGKSVSEGTKTAEEEISQ